MLQPYSGVTGLSLAAYSGNRQIRMASSSPAQNGDAGTAECLNENEFMLVDDARCIIAPCRIHNNQRRSEGLHCRIVRWRSRTSEVNAYPPSLTLRYDGLWEQVTASLCLSLIQNGNFKRNRVRLIMLIINNYLLWNFITWK